MLRVSSGLTAVAVFSNGGRYVQSSRSRLISCERLSAFFVPRELRVRLPRCAPPSCAISGDGPGMLGGEPPSGAAGGD